MTESLSLIRQSELPHRLVLDYETAEALGKVSEVWLDPYAHTSPALRLLAQIDSLSSDWAESFQLS